MSFVIAHVNVKQIMPFDGATMIFLKKRIIKDYFETKASKIDAYYFTCGN
jgi:hypothetical protein